MIDSPCQPIGPCWITKRRSPQRHWCHPRSPHPLLGKADQEAYRRKGQISLSHRRQILSKSNHVKSQLPSWEMHFHLKITRVFLSVWIMPSDTFLADWKKKKNQLFKSLNENQVGLYSRRGSMVLTAKANHGLVRRGWLLRLKVNPGHNISQNFNNNKKIQHIV